MSQEIKAKNNQLRDLHKKAIRGLVPDRTIDRQKQGFCIPIHDGFLGRCGDEHRENLEEFRRVSDFLDRSEISNLLDQRTAKHKTHTIPLLCGHRPKQWTRQIWTLIAFAP